MTFSGDLLTTKKKNNFDRRYALERFVRFIDALLTTAICASVLSVEDFARLSLVFTLFSLAVIGGRGSADSVFIVWFSGAQNASRRSVLTSGSVLLALYQAALAIVLAIYLYFLVSTGALDTRTYEVLALLILGLAASWVVIPESALIADGSYREAARLRTWSTGFFTLAKLLLALMDAEWILFVWSTAAMHISYVVITVYFWVYGRSLVSFDPSFIKQRTNRSVGSQLIPLFGVSLLTALYVRIDMFMLAQFGDLNDVATYSLAVRGFEAIQAAGIILSMAALKSMTDLYNHDERTRLLKVLRLVCMRTYALAGLLALVFYALGEYFIVLFFGEAYAPAFFLGLILIFAGAFAVLGSFFSRLHTVRGESSFILVRVIIAAILSISTNLILIPDFGADGAAVATLISIIGSNLLFDCLHPRLRWMFRLKVLSGKPFGKDL